MTDITRVSVNTYMVSSIMNCLYHKLSRGAIERISGRSYLPGLYLPVPCNFSAHGGD